MGQGVRRGKCSIVGHCGGTEGILRTPKLWGFSHDLWVNQKPESLLGFRAFSIAGCYLNTPACAEDFVSRPDAPSACCRIRIREHTSLLPLRSAESDSNSITDNAPGEPVDMMQPGSTSLKAGLSFHRQVSSML